MHFYFNIDFAVTRYNGADKLTSNYNPHKITALFAYTVTGAENRRSAYHSC